jgi:hypothetical protein
VMDSEEIVSSASPASHGSQADRAVTFVDGAVIDRTKRGKLCTKYLELIRDDSTPRTEHEAAFSAAMLLIFGSSVETHLGRKY